MCPLGLKENFSIDTLRGLEKPPLHKDMPLLDEVAECFIAMQKEAASHDLQIRLFSGYRSFEQQNAIWQRKYNYLKKTNMPDQDIIKKIIEYVAIPGTSRHHWGTEIDIVGPELECSDPLQTSFFMDTGVYANIYQWLLKKSAKFGFFMPYDNNKLRKGFKFEPWHFSYKQLSRKFTRCYLDVFCLDWLNDKRILGSGYFNANFADQYRRLHLKGIADII